MKESAGVGGYGRRKEPYLEIGGSKQSKVTRGSANAAAANYGIRESDDNARIRWQKWKDSSKTTSLETYCETRSNLNKRALDIPT